MHREHYRQQNNNLGSYSDSLYPLQRDDKFSSNISQEHFQNFKEYPIRNEKKSRSVDTRYDERKRDALRKHRSRKTRWLKFALDIFPTNHALIYLLTLAVSYGALYFYLKLVATIISQDVVISPVYRRPDVNLSQATHQTQTPPEEAKIPVKTPAKKLETQIETNRTAKFRVSQIFNMLKYGRGRTVTRCRRAKESQSFLYNTFDYVDYKIRSFGEYISTYVSAMKECRGYVDSQMKCRKDMTAKHHKRLLFFVNLFKVDEQR